MIIVNKEVIEIMIDRIRHFIVYNYESQLLESFKEVVVRENDKEEERKELSKFVDYCINDY
jgi:hypothetical protein